MASLKFKCKVMKKIAVGIDFAKEKFDMTAINVVERTSVHGQFKNSPMGARDMLRAVRKFARGIDSEDWMFCGEDTGYYSQRVTRYLTEKGYFMWLQNAYSIKRSEGVIRRGKDDKADSRCIAEYARRFEDKAVRYKLPPKELEDLKMLLSQRDLLVSAKTKLHNSTSEIPERKVQGSAVSLIKSANKRVCRVIDDEIKKLEDKMDEIIDSVEAIKENYDILCSFTGVARINTLAFIVYTENFTKFDFNARKIATYWGVAPFHRESGTSVHTSPHVSGFCNKKLKALIGNAATVAIKYNSVINAYYNRLLERGKCPMIAKNNVKNKIIHILTAMVRNKQKFDKEYFFTFDTSVKNVKALAS